jgi:hypothetical protein
MQNQLGPVRAMAGKTLPPGRRSDAVDEMLAKVSGIRLTLQSWRTMLDDDSAALVDIDAALGACDDLVRVAVTFALTDGDAHPDWLLELGDIEEITLAIHEHLTGGGDAADDEGGPARE